MQRPIDKHVNKCQYMTTGLEPTVKTWSAECLIDFFVELNSITELTRSVAVISLENLSPDPDDAYFTAGIHEDIIIQLSRIGDL